MNFAIELVPTPDRIYFPVYDFGQPLSEAINQANWWEPRTHTVNYYPIDMLSENPCTKEIIPVGTPAFVEGFIRRIPEYSFFELSQLLIPDFLDQETYLFSNKEPADSTDSAGADILSRWRVFIFEDRILDCRCYLGNGFEPPERKFIQRFVELWKNKPKAMAIDIGVMKNGGNIIIDAQNFMSCQLYGFQSRYLPSMFAAGYKFELKNRLAHVGGKMKVSAR